MKPAFLCILLGLICYTSCLSQEIKIYKTFGGVRFEMDTLVISPKQVLELLKVEPIAYQEFKRAKLNYNVAGVLGFTGGILIAIPLGTAIVGGEPEWGLAAGGAALLLASIPFNRAFKNRAVYALDLYNKNHASRIKPTFYFAGTHGRLLIRF